MGNKICHETKTDQMSPMRRNGRRRWQSGGCDERTNSNWRRRCDLWRRLGLSSSDKQRAELGNEESPTAAAMASGIGGGDEETARCSSCWEAEDRDTVCALPLIAAVVMPPADDSQTRKSSRVEQLQRLHARSLAPLLLAMSGVAANVPIRKRSQRLSDFSDIAHHADSQDGISLSSRQQALLKSAWTEMTSKKDGSNAGEWILKRIFDKHPEIKALFGMENVAKKKLAEQPQFKIHSEKFNDTLQMVVEGVDALDNSLGPLLFSYGSKHATLATAKGFRPEHWDVFSEAMVDYVAHWKGRLSQRVETIQAWRLLALFVVSKVRLGFDTELRAVEALVDRGVSLFPPPPLPLRKHSANACCLFQPTTTTQLRPPNPAD